MDSSWNMIFILLACTFVLVNSSEVLHPEYKKTGISKRSSESCYEIHERCFEIGSEMEEHFEDVADTSIIADLSEEQLDDICRIYARQDRCFDEFYNRDHCYYYRLWYHDYLEYAAYNDTYYFMCYNARDAYLANDECLSSEEVHDADQICEEEYEENMDSLEEHLRDPYYLRDQLCQHLDDYLDCIEHNVADICGDDAALFMKVLYTKNLETVASQIGCVLDTSGYYHFGAVPATPVFYTTTEAALTATDRSFGAPQVGIIVGLVLIGCLFITGICIACILKYQFDKKRQSQMARRNHHTRNAPVVVYGAGRGYANAIYGPSNDPLPEKNDSGLAISAPGAPPPAYVSQQNVHNESHTDNNNPDVDRNVMLSPPPPYAISQDMPCDTDRYSNPLYNTPNGAPPPSSLYQ